MHAFTDLGMNIQLYLLMYLFMWGAAILAGRNPRERLIVGAAGLVLGLITLKSGIPAVGLFTLLTGVGTLIYFIQKQVPTITKEENTSSREFWMFIGSLVFFLSAIVIIAKTSLPVLNALFNLTIAAPEDPEYGGAGMDTVSYVLAIEEISKIDASVSVAMSVNNSLVCYGLQESNFGAKIRAKLIAD